MKIYDKAFLVAEKQHVNQSYGIYPYIFHIKSVVEIAELFGLREEIVIGCILHDILEDTGLSFNDIKKEFGEEIAEIVYCVTDELGRNRKERKLKTYPKIKNNWMATAVKLCDRISNVLESKNNGSRMYETYRKEHHDFKDNLYDENHPQEVQKLWVYLENKFNDSNI